MSKPHRYSSTIKPRAAAGKAPVDRGTARKLTATKSARRTIGKKPSSSSSGQPVFAQPTPSSDPTSFKNPVTDSNVPDTAGVQPVPEPITSAAEPILTLAQIYGDRGSITEKNIETARQIVFHSVGDTGSAKGPGTQSLVADKMVSDFAEASAADAPSFFYHLGDVVYYFGESEYYYDQFFESYRSYPGPILGIPGNHDGIVYPSDPATTLAAYLRNFCAAAAAPSPDAGGLARTTMVQPGVYYTFDAPFVRIFGLYSNVLEDPGVISAQNGTYSTLDQRQVAFLTTALERAKNEHYGGALIIATHHPPFTGGSDHGESPLMLNDLDNACTAAGI